MRKSPCLDKTLSHDYYGNASNTKALILTVLCFALPVGRGAAASMGRTCRGAGSGWGALLLPQRRQLATVARAQWQRAKQAGEAEKGEQCSKSACRHAISAAQAGTWPRGWKATMMEDG